jgi:hypothetical protein
MAESNASDPLRRNAKLRIPLLFEDAVRAGLETKPPEKAPRKQAKKP